MTKSPPAPATPAAESLLLASRRFNRANFIRGQAIVDGGLSYSEWHLLSLLQQWPDPDGARPSELARKQRVTAANVTQQLRNLEKQALVERRQDNSDRRVVLVKLTALGVTRLKQVRNEFLQHYQRLVKHLGGSDAAQLARLLNEAADCLESTEPGLC